MNGRGEVGRYFHNYARLPDWHFGPGLVEGHPAVLVRERGAPVEKPTYFVLLTWAGGAVVNIRDFYFARYATEGAELVALD